MHKTSKVNERVDCPQLVKQLNYEIMEMHVQGMIYGYAWQLPQ